MVYKFAAAMAITFAAGIASAQQPAARTLNIQATWPTAVTAWTTCSFSPSASTS